MWVRAGPLVILFILLFASIAQGAVAEWDYYITDADQSMIDSDKTTADIDTAKNEITLKQVLPRGAAFYKGSLEYVVLSPTGYKHFSFDGASIREVPILSNNAASNPLAVYTGDTPDAVLFDQSKNEITHYSFDGSGLTRNPILSVAGLANIVSIGKRSNDLAFIQDKDFKYYGFDGAALTPVASLSKTLTNPIDFALVPDSFNTVIIDDRTIRYYKAGTEVSTITDLKKPMSVSANSAGIAVVDDGKVKHYTLSGNNFTYSSAMTISGLTNPRCVAIQPDSQDRIVLDGNQVKYYSFDGTNLVYNPALSTTVTDLDKLFMYIRDANVVSSTINIPRDVNQARVRAYCETPAGTSITWSLSVDDGSTWFKKWRIADGVVYTTPDNGTTWEPIGAPDIAYPTNNEVRLVQEFSVSGRKVRWKADLSGTQFLTPKIRSVAGAVAVKVDINTKPNTPTIDPDHEIPDPSASCLNEARPTLKWGFSDPDDGDDQSGYHIQLSTKTGTMLIDKDVLLDVDGNIAKEQSFKVPADVLFYSGECQFSYRVKIRDKGGLWSDNYSSTKDFCVVSFEAPRIVEIVHPPSGQLKPDPNDPATYIPIQPGEVTNDLPKTKAGGKVGLLINGIGLDLPNINLVVPYNGRFATYQNGTPYAKEKVGNTNNKFLLNFWTSAQPADCPDGTVIHGEFTGNNLNTHTEMNFKNEPGAYAEGLLTTLGTVLNDWMVVLQGRDQ